jgi:signal transduction histidine kinase/CheY-like chemotaxis protein/HPt (histidine-containing phosphotransfer) domain-containing protein
MKKQLTQKKKTIFGSVIRTDFPQLIVVFLSFALMVLVSYLFVSRIVQKQIFNNAREMLQTAETKIRSDFREAEVALINISLFVEDGLQSGWSTNDLKNYLTWQNAAFIPKETGIPGFFNFFCYINRKFISARRNWDPPADYDPGIRSWYIAAEKANGGIGYSSPYTDLITGKHVLSLTRMMGEAENRWFIGIGLNLEPLFDYVNNLQAREGGYGFLVNEDFILMVHPNQKMLNNPLEEMGPFHAELTRKLSANPREVIVQRMPNWQGIEVVLVSKQLFNGWYLSIATPVNRYYQDVYSMALLLSILGLGFMTVVSTFLIRLGMLKARSDEENREKTSFLARMSHEIRTPLHSILGMAEIIQRKSISSEVQEYISILHQSGQNLLAIINDILDFSRIESNRLNIEKHQYCIASMINDTINMIRPRIAEKSLDFTVNMDGNIPARLVGDNGRLRQILINLLSNSIKYTRKGFVSLDVAMEAHSGNTLTLVFSVEDSGIGIKPEDIERLFAEFTRLDAKVNQGIEGTGLGLVITRALCRAMGGDITVSSEYGKGSLFQARVVQELEDEDEPPVAQVHNRQLKRALFFDWRPRYLRSITDTFQNLGVQAVCSPDFAHFQQDLEKGDYDYAFISSKHAMDCIYTLGKRDSPLQLVIMVELGEVSVFREVSSILMPVYSVTLANVLNDRRHDEGIPSQAVKLNIHFTAPEANVLIVDDISTNLRVAKELMNPYNMNIHTCLSGAEAVELVEQSRYDLVFMDHMMPGMDGIEATARIRALEYGDGYLRKLPIIALTANAVTGQRELFLQSGIDDFLAKPIDIQKLNDILEKWLPREKRIAIPRTQEEAGPDESEADDSESIDIPGVDAISGLDAEAGLRNIGGSPEVYFDILADFCRDAESRAVKITEALENGDTKLYITLVHALKGAARSIGATETGEAAAWLEKSAETEAPALIREKTAELLENLRSLADNIKNAEKERENADGRERKDLSALNLEALKAALAGMDIEAVNKILLEYSGLSLDTETKAKIADVEQHILMFEYDKAIEKINELF